LSSDCVACQRGSHHPLRRHTYRISFSHTHTPTLTCTPGTHVYICSTMTSSIFFFPHAHQRVYPFVIFFCSLNFLCHFLVFLSSFFRHAHCRVHHRLRLAHVVDPVVMYTEFFLSPTHTNTHAYTSDFSTHISLSFTATHHTTLQHTATHGNTRQHTATH